MFLQILLRCSNKLLEHKKEIIEISNLYLVGQSAVDLFLNYGPYSATLRAYSVLMNHSWLAQGTTWVLRIEPGSALCKTCLTHYTVTVQMTWMTLPNLIVNWILEHLTYHLIWYHIAHIAYNPFIYCSYTS